MFNHQYIVDSIKAVGIPLRNKGICFGISHTAMDLIITRKFQHLKDLNNLIDKNFCDMSWDKYQIIFIKPGCQLTDKLGDELLARIRSDGKYLVISYLPKEKNISVSFIGKENEKKDFIKKNNGILKETINLNEELNYSLYQILVTILPRNNDMFIKCPYTNQLDKFLEKTLKGVVYKFLHYYFMQKISFSINKRNEEVVKRYKDIRVDGKAKNEYLEKIKNEIINIEKEKITNSIKEKYSEQTERNIVDNDLLKKVDEKIDEMTDVKFQEIYNDLFLQEKNILEKTYLTKEERDLLQLKPFYYAIAIHQNPFAYFNDAEYSEWLLLSQNQPLSELHSSQNVMKSFSLVQSVGLDKIAKDNSIEGEHRLGILKAGTSLACYNLDKMQEFLLGLRQCFQDYQFNEPWSCILTGPDHCITIGFDPKDQIWQFVDSSQEIKEFPHGDISIMKHIIDAFSKINLVNLLIDLYVANDQEGQKAIYAFNEFKQGKSWQYIHALPLENRLTKDAEGGTLLYAAAQYGDAPLVEKILIQDKKINPNQAWGALWTNTNNEANCVSPLYIAVQNGHFDIVKLLLAHKDIDPNISKGHNPLLIAATKGAISFVKELLAHSKINPNICSEDFTSIVFIAAENGHTDIVKLLLNHPGIQDPHAPRKDQQVTPIGVAASKGHADVVKLLLQHGANPNTVLNIETKENLLQWATRNNHADIVQLIQEKNAEKNIRKSFKLT